MRPRWFLPVLGIYSVLSFTTPAERVTFRQASADQTGIRWSHVNAKSDHRYLPETIAPGVAVFDYNNDGWMDILFVNSGDADFFHPARPLHPALYRNNRDGTFTDVTEQAGLR